MELLNVLGINSTFYVQVLNFLILVVILRFVLYKPLLETMEKRKSDAKKLEDMKAEMETELENIEILKKKEVSEGKAKAGDILKEAKKDAKVSSVEILDQAKTEKEKMLKVYEEELKQKISKHEKSLKNEVTEMTLSVLQEIVKEDPKLQKKVTDKILETVNG